MRRTASSDPTSRPPTCVRHRPRYAPAPHAVAAVPGSTPTSSSIGGGFLGLHLAASLLVPVDYVLGGTVCMPGNNPNTTQLYYKYILATNERNATFMIIYMYTCIYVYMIIYIPKGKSYSLIRCFALCYSFTNIFSRSTIRTVLYIPA